MRREFADTIADRVSDGESEELKVPFDDGTRMPAYMYRDFLYTHVVENKLPIPAASEFQNSEEQTHHDFENDAMGA